MKNLILSVKDIDDVFIAENYGVFEDYLNFLYLFGETPTMFLNTFVK